MSQNYFRLLKEYLKNSIN